MCTLSLVLNEPDKEKATKKKKKVSRVVSKAFTLQFMTSFLSNKMDEYDTDGSGSDAEVYLDDEKQSTNTTNESTVEIKWSKELKRRKKS